MDLTRHKKLRMKGHDYSAVGYYFLTIVTEGRLELFRHVSAGLFLPNEAGLMITQCINSLEARFNGLELLNSAVMPNHMHLIIFNNNGHNISEVMRQFKATTSRMYKKGMAKNGWKEYGLRLWQRSFFDIIIRNQRMFDYINNYVSINPERWAYDKINDGHGQRTDEIYKEINDLR